CARSRAAPTRRFLRAAMPTLTRKTASAPTWSAARCNGKKFSRKAGLAPAFFSPSRGAAGPRRRQVRRAGRAGPPRRRPAAGRRRGGPARPARRTCRRRGPAAPRLGEKKAGARPAFLENFLPLHLAADHVGADAVFRVSVGIAARRKRRVGAALERAH